jgi:hypothetical protein
MNEVELMRSQKCKLKIEITTGPHPKTQTSEDEGTKAKKLNLFSMICPLVWSRESTQRSNKTFSFIIPSVVVEVNSKLRGEKYKQKHNHHHHRES